MAITKDELAARVLDQITNHPESWDQYTWWSWGDNMDDDGAFVDDILRTRDECGTTGCVAGWTVAIALREGYATTSTRLISEAARKLLELSDNEASWLFRTVRTQEEVTAALQAIKDGESLHDVIDKYGDDDV